MGNLHAYTPCTNSNTVIVPVVTPVVVPVVVVPTAPPVVTTSMTLFDLEQGSAFNKCIKIGDFETKTLKDKIQVREKESGGCCPNGYTPGAKYYAKYQGAQVVCGFKADGTIAISTGSALSAKTCSYNQCYIHKQHLPCSGTTRQFLNGCCGAAKGARNFEANCKHYDYSLTTAYGNKYSYCLTYDDDYAAKGMLGSVETSDDQVFVGTSKLNLGSLYTYAPCDGAIDIDWIHTHTNTHAHTGATDGHAHDLVGSGVQAAASALAMGMTALAMMW